MLAQATARVLPCNCSACLCLPVLTAALHRSLAVQEVPVLVAQAADLIEKTLDPKDTCEAMGICPGSSAAQLLGVDAAKVLSLCAGS